LDSRRFTLCAQSETRLRFRQTDDYRRPSINDSAYLTAGHTFTAIALFLPGRITTGSTALEQAIAAYGLETQAPMTVELPDILAPLLTYNAANLWLMGYPARAVKKREQALVMAKQLSHRLA